MQAESSQNEKPSLKPSKEPNMSGFRQFDSLYYLDLQLQVENLTFVIA